MVTGQGRCTDDHLGHSSEGRGPDLCIWGGGVTIDLLKGSQCIQRMGVRGVWTWMGGFGWHGGVFGPPWVDTVVRREGEEAEDFTAVALEGGARARKVGGLLHAQQATDATQHRLLPPGFMGHIGLLWLEDLRQPEAKENRQTAP